MSTAVGGISLRPETPADVVAVRALLQASFGRQAEAALVDRLRAEGSIALALVADADGIAGYVAFPRIEIETASGVTPALALAPLAVAASHQGQGIGAMLVRAGLAELIRRREEIVFALGDPALYNQFGFAAEDARPFASPYVGPHFMARRLAAKAPRRGRLRYPAAFEAL